MYRIDSVVEPDAVAFSGTHAEPLSLKWPTTFTPEVLVQIPPEHVVCGSSTTRHRILAGRPSIRHDHVPKYHWLATVLASADS